MKLSNLRLLTLFITIIILTVISGCGRQSNKPVQNQSGKSSQPLIQIEESINSIIDVLDKEGKFEQAQEAGEDTNAKDVSKTTGSSQSQNSQQQSGQSDQQQGQQQGQQQTQQQGQQQTQAPSPWEQADRTVKSIHKKWNEYQPEAVKVGIQSEIINNFTNDLNILTNDIANKNLMNTLNDANNLYKYIPEFLSHYKEKSIDIKKLRYYTRDVMYKSRFDKWDFADTSIASAKSILPNLRINAKENVKKNYESLEYAVYDMEKVTKDRQKSLIQIKGNVVLDNIKNIEKFIKNESEKEEQNKK